MAIDLEKIVQSRYGSVAQSGLSSENASVRDVAKAFGYSEEELRSDSGGREYGALLRQSDRNGEFEAG